MLQHKFPDAKEIANRLQGHTEALCTRLLSNGKKEGCFWVVGDCYNSKGQSLKVNLRSTGGYAQGRWYDYATNEGGDMLDMIAKSQFGGDKKRAYQYALAYLGICKRSAHTYSTTHHTPPDSCPQQDSSKKAIEQEKQDSEAKRKGAIRMCKSAVPLTDTMAQRYLIARGLEKVLTKHDLELGFLAQSFHAFNKENLPAMVAVVRNKEGSITGCHRSFLRNHRASVVKIQGRYAKLSYGHIKGNFIALRKDFFKEQSPCVYMTEGIEDALSILSIKPDVQVITAIALFNIGTIILPDWIREVVLAQDNDINKKTVRALERAKAKLCKHNPHITLKTCRPPADYKDYNDWLRGHKR